MSEDRHRCSWTDSYEEDDGNNVIFCLIGVAFVRQECVMKSGEHKFLTETYRQYGAFPVL